MVSNRKVKMAIVKKVINEKCPKIAAGAVAIMVNKTNLFLLMQPQSIIPM